MGSNEKGGEMDKFEKGSTDLVATIVPTKGEPQTLVYDDTTASGILVQDSIAYVGIELAPEYIEAFTETVDRSRGLIDGGFKVSLKLPDALGGFGFEFERKPKRQTKTIKKAIFRPKK